MTRLIQRTTALAATLMIAAGCSSFTGKTAGQTVDDTSMSAQIKTRLTADHASNLTRIDVDTHNGIAYLTGVVETDEQKDRAQQLAERVDGVRDVVNNLQVQPREDERAQDDTRRDRAVGDAS